MGQVEGDGFPRQRAAVEMFAARNGLELVGEYLDHGVSGTTDLEARPALSDLLARVLTNGVRVVIVERADRLARDLLVAELILRQLREAGVQVLEAEGGNDLTQDQNPTAKLMRQILSAFAEFDRAVTVAKLAAARRRVRKSRGRCEGAKPFGFLPGEAETLDRLRQLRRKPRGCDAPTWQQVADAANAEGLATRTGSRWSRSAVHKILTRS